jgi:hypothetical protein
MPLISRQDATYPQNEAVGTALAPRVAPWAVPVRRPPRAGPLAAGCGPGLRPAAAFTRLPMSDPQMEPP